MRVLCCADFSHKLFGDDPAISLSDLWKWAQVSESTFTISVLDFADVPHGTAIDFDIFLKIVSVFNLLTETELLKVRVELNRRLFEADCCGVGAAVPLLHLR